VPEKLTAVACSASVLLLICAIAVKRSMPLAVLLLLLAGANPHTPGCEAASAKSGRLQAEAEEACQSLSETMLTAQAQHNTTGAAGLATEQPPATPPRQHEELSGIAALKTAFRRYVVRHSNGFGGRNSHVGYHWMQLRQLTIAARKPTILQTQKVHIFGFTPHVREMPAASSVQQRVQSPSACMSRLGRPVGRLKCAQMLSRGPVVLLALHVGSRGVGCWE
jgi:hypothetical protein